MRLFQKAVLESPPEEQTLAQKTSRYVPAPKRAAPTNPIVLSVRSAAVAFWSMVAVIGVMVVAAAYWLLTHPVTA